MRLIPCGLLALTLATPAFAQEWPTDRKAGAEFIRAEQLEAWLTMLASDRMFGRATGEPGFELAAIYVREHFRSLELEQLGSDDYFQRVPWTRATLDPTESFVSLERAENGGSRTRVAMLPLGDGMNASATVDSHHDAPLALIRFDDDFDTVSKLDVEDHNVIAVAKSPIKALRTYYKLSRAVRNADGRLIAVVDRALTLLVEPSAQSIPGGPEDRIAKSRHRRPRVCALEPTAFAQALAPLSISLESILASKRAVKPAGIAAVSKITMHEEPAPAYNVAAVLRGSDPKLRDEFVVVGSHLDHLGKKGDTFCPGADDDASGTVGVLALAHAFTKNAKAPRRSVVFVTFCGEENGLIGSAHFAKNSPIPLENIVAELQLDMIGRSEEHPGEPATQNRNCLHLIGTQKLSNELHALCLRLNRDRAKFDLEWDEEDVFYRSDHWNFAREGVPAAFFFTGFHGDYHQPSDTVDKIEFPKLTRVVRYVYDIAFELAMDDARPHVARAKWQALKSKGRREPVAPVRD